MVRALTSFLARIFGGEEIRRAHERYELVARATNDVIWDWDAEKGVIVWNEALRTMFGYDPDHIDNRLHWWDQHLHPDDRDRAIANINRVIESSDSVWTDEYRFERADGSYAEVLDRGYITRGADGKPLRMIGAMLDVTERKRVERIAGFMAEASALLASSLDYEATLNRVAALAVPVLADCCIIDMRDEEKSLAVAHADPDHVCEIDRNLVREVIATGKPVLTRSALVVALAIPDGAPIGALSLVTSDPHRVFDERDLHIAEDLASRAAMAIEHARLFFDVQNANRAKDDFLATLSHELRTPLTAILGWARLLTESDLDPDSRNLGLDTIQRSALAQARLIDDVLDVSRVTTGKLRLNVQPLAIEEVVRRSIDAVRLAAEAKGIELVLPRTHTGWVTGDADRLQQVIWNLLNNAIKFTPQGGRVEVTVEMTPAAVRLSVSDTGQGIAREFLPHVFEPFRQAESGTTRVHGGLGLGLAIVRYLIEAHGGTVEAFSDGLGCGTRFTIELPRASVGERVDVVTPSASVVSLKGMRVLFVDDQEDARQLAGVILTRAGAESIVVSSAAEALEVLEGSAIDALVTDIAMPGADGYSLVRELRKADAIAGRRTPALAVSALGNPEDRIRALTAGFDAYLHKPMEPNELTYVIAQICFEGQV